MTPEFLRALGFCLIPIRHGTKKAAVGWAEFQRRHPSDDEFQAWTERYDSWAIVTGSISGIVVVDCDSPQALAWAEEHLPATPMQVLTGEKAPGFRGRHLYYRHPGARVGNKARIRTDEGKLALDVRGDGGYVLAPGSPHPSGLQYDAVAGFGDVHPSLLPILALERLEANDEPAETPQVPYLRAVPSDSERFNRARLWMEKREPAVEGQGGDDHTFRTACNLVRGFELDDDDAMALLLEWNQLCCPTWTQDELQQKLDNARAYGKDPFGSLLWTPGYVPKRATNGEAAPLPPEPKPVSEWAPPEPLLQFDPPTFPLGFLPHPLGDFAGALAIATQTPPDLAGMLVLAAVATCAQRYVEVEARRGWVEPINLYTVTVLPPANRKSAVMSAVTRPLLEWERIQAEANRQAVIEAEEAQKALTREIELLRKKGAPSTQIIPLREHLERIEVPTAPRLVADDITPERAASLMGENGERLAILSAEGGIFDIIAGRYSNGSANVDLFLKSHNGEPLKVDRQRREREPVYLTKPALTLGLAIQPGVLDGLFEVPNFRDRGLLGRLVFTLPKSLVGRRQVCPEPVSSDLIEEYRYVILGLLDTVSRLEEPLVLQLSREGHEALVAFEKRLEPRLDPYAGDLGEIGDWAGKSAGLAARIAALLHLPPVILSVLSTLSPSTEYNPLLLSTNSLLLIQREQVEQAISLVEDYLIPHAQNAFLRMGSDPLLDTCRRLLTWIQQRDCFTKRELHRAFEKQTSFRQATNLDAPLAKLEAHGFIRRVPSDRPGPGRPPSPTWLVNPIQPHSLS